MDNAGYVALSRQAGLLKTLDVIANNIANVSTSGYKREDTAFAEHIKALEGEEPSLSMATMNRRFIDLSPGDMRMTGSALDFAIQGEGFFLIETPNGERLTRAGAFALNANGEIVTPDGNAVLDEGGSALAVPQEASTISVASDGTITADGAPVGRIGVVAASSQTLTREGSNLFIAEEGYQAVQNPGVVQGALEGSNVSAVAEIAELIDVQRAYERGQKLIETEDERIRQAVRQLGETR
ncbi:MAG: flagellar hook-basal body complex protein [Pseudomonadota bacterium]